MATFTDFLRDEGFSGEYDSLSPDMKGQIFIEWLKRQPVPGNIHFR